MISDAHSVLENEGFAHIYDWHDEPKTEYPSHTHKGKVVIFVEKGDVTFVFSDGTSVSVQAGERFDVPVNVAHRAIVGEEGCDYVVGEMIKGDS